MLSNVGFHRATGLQYRVVETNDATQPWRKRVVAATPWSCNSSANTYSLLNISRPLQSASGDLQKVDLGEKRFHGTPVMSWKSKSTNALKNKQAPRRAMPKKLTSRLEVVVWYLGVLYNGAPLLLVGRGVFCIAEFEVVQLNIVNVDGSCRSLRIHYSSSSIYVLFWILVLRTAEYHILFVNGGVILF